MTSSFPTKIAPTPTRSRAATARALDRHVCPVARRNYSGLAAPATLRKFSAGDGHSLHEPERRSPIRRVGNRSFETRRVGDRRSNRAVHGPNVRPNLEVQALHEPPARNAAFRLQSYAIARTQQPEGGVPFAVRGFHALQNELGTFHEHPSPARWLRVAAASRCAHELPAGRLVNSQAGTPAPPRRVVRDVRSRSSPQTRGVKCQTSARQQLNCTSRA